MHPSQCGIVREQLHSRGHRLPPFPSPPERPSRESVLQRAQFCASATLVPGTPVERRRRSSRRVMHLPVPFVRFCPVQGFSLCFIVISFACRRCASNEISLLAFFTSDLSLPAAFGRRQASRFDCSALRGGNAVPVYLAAATQPHTRESLLRTKCSARFLFVCLFWRCLFLFLFF